MSNAFPLREQASGPVAAPAPVLFAHLDDPHRLSSHMERPSMRMPGTGMSISTDAQGGRAIGSVIRMQGRVLGLALRLEEAVTERDPPLAKAWETLGEPHRLVIGAYRMGFRIEPAGAGASLLTVSIDYGLPARGAARVLGRLLGPAYARWCCRQMLRDAQAAFAPGTPAAAAG